MRRAVLNLDCGATNVKAGVVDSNGQILSVYSLPNETCSDPNYEGGLIWDIKAIWEKICLCSRKAVGEITDTEIIAVTVTTFGVDGAAMKKDGTLGYPVISWQCSRTVEIEKNIRKYCDPDWLFSVTGLQSYHFNTLYKLLWLHEHHPSVLDEMDYYVLMPSLIIYFITGEFVTDTSMAGTSMLTSLKDRKLSEDILALAGVTSTKFPRLTEPGTSAGKATKDGAAGLGIKPGIPVIVAGHDTQLALIGSGAGINQPVISSGTWDILMVRAQASSLLSPGREWGVTIELDSQAGLINPGVQWVSSGVLEWFGKMLYADIPDPSTKYRVMIEEAGAISAGSLGVVVVPELFKGGFSGKKSSISGFSHETGRAHIYRAALEALSYYTRLGMERLQRTCKYTPENIICVGGGSRNALWNQVRADVLGLPVMALDMKETTSLGAAILAFVATGMYASEKEAFAAMDAGYTTFTPGPDREAYERLYREFYERQ